MPSALSRRDVFTVKSWWSPENLLQAQPCSDICKDLGDQKPYPENVSQRDVLTFQASRNPEKLCQSRSYSTATQDPRIDDIPTAANFHGPNSISQSYSLDDHDRPDGGQRNVHPHFPESPARHQRERTLSPQPTSQTVPSIRTVMSGSQILYKRKPESRDTPSTQWRRQSPIASSELKDEAYIRRMMHVPSQEDYPTLSAIVFEQPKSVLYNALSMMNLEKHTNQLRNGVFRCTMACAALDIYALAGEGRSKTAAETAACLHVMARLHELGKFADLFETNIKIRQDLITEERDAKIDIYNYAARFNCIPEMHILSVREQGLRSGRGAQRIVEVEVIMKEQNIKVIGRGKGLSYAEIAAAVKFKQEAERFQTRQGTESFVVKDSSSLTTSNAKAFFEFYRIVHPRARIDVETKVAEDMKAYDRHGLLRSQILLDQRPIGTPVLMTSKKKAEDLAYLTAALDIKNREPDTYPKFLQALRIGNGEILRPVPPIDMPVNEGLLLTMQRTLSNARRAGLPDEVDEVLPDEGDETVRRFDRPKLSQVDLVMRNWHLQQMYTAYLHDSRLEELRRKRSELPMNQYKSKVLDLITNNPYSIIVGATGSGKTTQVPQILLEHEISNGVGGSCNITCTQPRRIAATSVARRVAEERAENLQESVGYHVRFDAKLARPGGCINYCTTGILLQRLQHNPEDVMNSNSHIIIDEVHERDILIDFLLILLKKAVNQRLSAGKSVPNIVLMSATMDTDLFASYFSTTIDGTEYTCPCLSVPGRTFPVKEMFLDSILGEMRNTYREPELQLLATDLPSKNYLVAEREFARANPSHAKGKQTETTQPDEFVIDWKKERKVTADGEAIVSTEKEDALVPYGLVAITIAHIAKTSTEGAILVFLPGLDEIVQVEKMLNGCRPLGVVFDDKSKFEVHMLHSSLPAGQQEVFSKVAEGCRKIILATNIAETSITIPDVQYVVDSGKLREKQYDQVRRITKLQCTWLSKSNSKQRAGRAGRVQNGNYYALFSKARYESLRAIGLPEMLRADLQEICLDIKAQAFNIPIRQFLADAIEPPPPTAVDASVMNLQALDALTEEEMITPLGRLLASLPVHPSLGKMIVLGIIFRCLDPILILGAAAGERSIFLNPLEVRREAQDVKISFAEGSGSDHIAVLNAIRHLRNIRNQKNDYYMRDFANQNFIHANSFKSIDSTARQIEEILVEAGLIPFIPPYGQANSEYGDPALNENAHQTPLIKALIMAGLHPNLAISTGGRSFRTPGEKGAMVHPTSVNALKDKNESLRFGTMHSYTTMSRSNDGNSLFLRDTSVSTPLMASLFGGRLQLEGNNMLNMDGWLPFRVQSSECFAAKKIFEFRKAMERLFVGVFKDLAVNKRVAPGAQTRFLADEEVREMFARGLVEVLECDAKKGESVAKVSSSRAETRSTTNSWRSRGSAREENSRAKPGFYRDLMAGKY